MSAGIVLGSYRFSFAQIYFNNVNPVNELQQKLINLDKQIDSYQSQIQKTRGQQASLANEIKLYDDQLTSTQLAIEAKQTQIDDTKLQTTALQTEIDKRYKEIGDNKKILSQLLVQINQRDDNSLLNITLGNQNFSEVLDQVQYAENVQDKVYQIIDTIGAAKNKLVEQQGKLKATLTKLQSLHDQLEITAQSLALQQQEKTVLLNKTHGLESNYRKLLSNSQDEEDKIQQEISDLDSSIRTRLGNRRIVASKGTLAWPMDGTVTQNYGNTGFTQLGYTFHNGIDIAAPAGQPVYAAADGKVLAADTGEAAYGNWIAIKHILSGDKKGKREVVALYGHLRSFNVRIGDSVLQGDMVGYEGNTGNTTRLLYGPERGYHLHFTVFDTEGFGVSAGKSANIYGPYTVPYGYSYDPLDFF